MNVNGDGTPDLSAVIKTIMQNPEFANLVRDIRGDEGKRGADVQSDMMKKLPEIMSMLGPMMSGQTEQEKHDNSSPPPKDAHDERNGNLKLLKDFDKFDKTKATRLMTAIKPYLSRERCDIIDKCMSVVQIGDLMTVLSGVEGLGKSDN